VSTDLRENKPTVTMISHLHIKTLQNYNNRSQPKILSFA